MLASPFHLDRNLLESAPVFVSIQEASDVGPHSSSLSILEPEKIELLRRTVCVGSLSRSNVEIKLNMSDIQCSLN